MDLEKLLNALAADIASRVLDGVRAAMPTTNGSEWLTAKEAALQLQISVSYLEHLRKYDGGPKFSKIGNRIRYQRSSVDEWARTRQKRRSKAQRELHA
jgi:excisionase family DNA binding protein